MDLKRFFTDKPITDDIAVLTGEEFIHAVKVTRHKVGYKLIVCNNGQYDYYATVSAIEKDRLIAKIDKKEVNNVESDFNLTLFIGNNKDLDTVVQKAVELGVKTIVPFVSQHCNEKKVNYDRVNKIILESSKQCGRSSLAGIRPMIDFDEMLTEIKGTQTFAFYEYEKDNTIHDATAVKSDTNIIIGCEGGFSSDEIEAINDLGIKTYTLGKRILRVSTAVVAAITLINDKLDNLK